MTPDSFSFTLTVPGDTRLVGVVRDLCAHAAGYAKLPEPAGASFCERVAAAATEAVGQGAGAPCPLVFDCGGGELRVTIGDRTITEPLTV